MVLKFVWTTEEVQRQLPQPMRMVFWHHIVGDQTNNGNIGNVVHYVDGVVSAHGGSGGELLIFLNPQIFLSVLIVPVQTGLILLVQ